MQIANTRRNTRDDRSSSCGIPAEISLIPTGNPYAVCSLTRGKPAGNPRVSLLPVPMKRSKSKLDPNTDSNVEPRSTYSRTGVDSIWARDSVVNRDVVDCITVVKSVGGDDCACADTRLDGASVVSSVT